MGRSVARFSVAHPDAGARLASYACACVLVLAALVGGTSCGAMAGWEVRDGGEAGGRAAEAPGDLGGFSVYVSRSGRHGRDFPLRGVPVVRDDVRMLYEHQIGMYPRIWKGEVAYGGTPVGLDLVAHTRKLREDIDRLVPDAQFDGILVFDYESRGLYWDRLGEAYKEIVRSRIRSVRSGIDAEELETLSEEAYDTATRRYMEVTIGLVRSMRPRAKLAKYWFPRATSTVERSGWLADLLDVMIAHMYPFHYSVSGVRPGKGQASIDRFVSRNLAEMEAAKRFAAGEKPVLGFVRPVYHEVNGGYAHRVINDLDARAITLSPEEEGLDGLIFWLHAYNPEEAADIEEGMQ
ncbi:MAG: hypothetical protein AAGH64_05925, partial [Planctomycetota bacterium]